jgi:hypothetical protein
MTQVSQLMTSGSVNCSGNVLIFFSSFQLLNLTVGFGFCGELGELNCMCTPTTYKVKFAGGVLQRNFDSIKPIPNEGMKDLWTLNAPEIVPC